MFHEDGSIDEYNKYIAYDEVYETHVKDAYDIYVYVLNVY